MSAPDCAHCVLAACCLVQQARRVVALEAALSAVLRLADAEGEDALFEVRQVALDALEDRPAPSPRAPRPV